MTDAATIAIVEDDDDIRCQLASYLEDEGFRVISLEGGAGLDRLIATGPRPHLIVLDWMLPGEDGLSICRRLREAGGPPVVMLTAKDEDIDKVLGLEMGADDYVSKPSAPAFCWPASAPCCAARTAPQPQRRPRPDRLAVADLVVDLAGRAVTIGEPATRSR